MVYDAIAENFVELLQCLRIAKPARPILGQCVALPSLDYLSIRDHERFAGENSTDLGENTF